MLSSNFTALRGSFRLRLAWTFNHRPLCTPFIITDLFSFINKYRDSPVFLAVYIYKSLQKLNLSVLINFRHLDLWLLTSGSGKLIYIRNFLRGDFVGVNKQQEIAKDYFLYNGDIFPSKEFDIEKTIVYPSVYEVIRVIDGVPLFSRSI